MEQLLHSIREEEEATAELSQVQTQELDSLRAVCTTVFCLWVIETVFCLWVIETQHCSVGCELTHGVAERWRRKLERWSNCVEKMHC